VLESSDRYAEACELTDKALELARRIGDRVWESIFLGGPISALVLLGRWDEALARLDESELLGGKGIDAALGSPAVQIFCERGDLPAAKAWLARAAGVRTEDEDVQTSAGYGMAETQLLRAEGRLVEALAAAEKLIALQPSLGATFLTVKCGLVEGLEAAFGLGEVEKVRELLAVVDELRPGERPPLLEAHAHRFRAKLAGDEGGFRAATALFRELSLRFALAVTLLEHGELLADRERRDDAEPLFEEARRIFEELGARPWLERVDQATAAEEAEAIS
jgi:tetratricopeptide (TPR) repeat protein